MRTRITVAAVVLIAMTVVGCSSSASDDKPAKTPTSQPARPTPTLDPAEARTACVDAIADAIQADNDPEDTGTRPDECKAVSDSDWLDVYMEGLRLHNKRNRDALGGAIDDAENQ